MRRVQQWKTWSTMLLPKHQQASIVNIALWRPVILKSIDPGISRHDAKFIVDLIIDTIESEEPSIGNIEDEVRAVVTDQPSVITSAWKEFEKRKPLVNCYGYGAHVINLLAGDFRKLDCVYNVLENLWGFCDSHFMYEIVCIYYPRGLLNVKGEVCKLQHCSMDSCFLLSWIILWRQPKTQRPFNYSGKMHFPI